MEGNEAIIICFMFFVLQKQNQFYEMCFDIPHVSFADIACIFLLVTLFFLLLKTYFTISLSYTYCSYVSCMKPKIRKQISVHLMSPLNLMLRKTVVWRILCKKFN